MVCTTCLLMFKYWFCWKCVFNNHRPFTFFIPVSCCKCRGNGALLCRGAVMLLKRPSCDIFFYFIAALGSNYSSILLLLNFVSSPFFLKSCWLLWIKFMPDNVNLKLHVSTYALLCYSIDEHRLKANHYARTYVHYYVKIETFGFYLTDFKFIIHLK